MIRVLQLLETPRVGLDDVLLKHLVEQPSVESLHAPFPQNPETHFLFLQGPLLNCFLFRQQIKTSANKTFPRISSQSLGFFLFPTVVLSHVLLYD